MKTKLFFLACAVFLQGCTDTPLRNTAENDDIETVPNGYADSIKRAKGIRKLQAESIGKIFVLPDSTLQNIAISGTISGYKDNVASGELVLTDKTTKKEIQKLPFMLNNKFSNVENCVETGDFDFDGNMDIVVPNGSSYDEFDIDYCNIYLYNSKMQQFVRNESISTAISNEDYYELFPNKKSLLVGSGSEKYYDIYKTKNNVACHIQSITEGYRDDGKVEVSVQKTTCDNKPLGKEKNYKHKPSLQNSKGEGYYRKYIE
jgi:hypothetical protein